MSQPIIQIDNVGKSYRLGQADIKHAMFRDGVPKLFANERYSLAIFFVARIVMRLQRAIEGVNHRDQIENKPLDSALGFFAAIPLSPFSKILEIGLAAH